MNKEVGEGSVATVVCVLVCVCLCLCVGRVGTACVLSPMFKKLEVSNKAQGKTSVARAIRAQVLESYPALEAALDVAWPQKKALVELIKVFAWMTLW